MADNIIQSVGDFSPDNSSAPNTGPEKKTSKGTHPTVTFEIMNPIGPTPPEAKQKYDPDTAAALVSQFESGGKNIPNYRYDVGHTASGVYQITDTNWQHYAPKLGIDIKQFPTAMSDKSEKLQRQVFDLMYNEQGFAPWANYNPRLAEAIGQGQLATPGWVPSPQAFDSEDRKSNTSLRYMSPEQYLSLLPPLEDDEGTKAKGENLKKSLAKGDNIEDLPSLEVEPKGDDLKVVDHDGRNRALAAIDAGVDRIPVAINGDSGDKEYKNIVGKKKLPYSEFKAVPPASALQEAQKIVPQAFAQGGVGAQQEQNRAQALAQPQAPSGPVPSSFDPALAAATAQSPVPTKPDYYPQIVAGVNNDIYNPRGIGYRGTGVPDLATNATAGERIAAANKNSAGQVGLPASSPASSMMGMLSNLNPIGSAQAAEAPIVKSVGDFTPNPTGPGIVQSTGDFTPNPTPGSYIPGPGAILDPISKTLLPPIANALTSWLANPIADTAALGARPHSWSDFFAARDKALGKLRAPETSVGESISNVLGAVGTAVQKIIKAGMPESTYNELAPYATVATDLIAPLAMGYAPARNALATPGGKALNKLVPSSREFRATKAVNKQQPGELAQGGLTPQEMQRQLDEAHAAGIPLTPADLAIPAGPHDKLLGYALEHSPEGVADSRKFLTERVEGIAPTPSAEPLGGTLERSIQQAEKHFGSGSFVDVSDALNKSISSNKKALTSAESRLAKIDEEIEARRIVGQPRYTASILASKEAAQKAVNDLTSQVSKENLNLKSLNYGKNLLKDAESNRVERINQFLKTLRGIGTKDAFDNLKLGLGDAIKHEYRRLRQEGKEPTRVNLPQDTQNKVAAVFGHDQTAADDFYSKAKTEENITNKTKDLLSRIKRQGYVSGNDKRQLHMVVESMGHLVAAPLAAHFGPLGIGIYSSYWLLKGARLLWNMSTTGGGVAARRYGHEIANMYLDPNAKLATSGTGLFNTPARRPSSSQANLNALAGALGPAGIVSATTANQQPQIAQ